MFFFELSTWLLLVLLIVVIVGATVIGLLAGRAVRHRSEDLREPFSVIQAALLGFMGLVLAFGLSLAVGRYETRRAAVVDEGNAIGTAYLRAQTIAEPQRSDSLTLLRRFTDTSIDISETVPGSTGRPEPSPRADRSNANCGRWPDNRSTWHRPTARRGCTSRA